MEETQGEGAAGPQVEADAADTTAFNGGRQKQPALLLRRALIALLCERLRQSRGGRWSTALALSLMTAFGLFALILRAVDGPSASLGKVVIGAAKLITCLASAPIAFSAAHDRARIDRDDGIEALAESHGVDRHVLRAIRAAAAMYQTALSIGLPILILSILLVLLSGTSALAIRNLSLMLGLSLFSILAGFTIGAIADLCGRIGMARGRSMLALIVLIPWLLSDLAEKPWSIPGALHAALNWLVRMSGFET